MLRERVKGAARSVDDFGGDYVIVQSDSIDEIAAGIDAWRNAGGTHVSIVTMGLGLDSVDAHIDYIASVADALSIAATRTKE